MKYVLRMRLQSWQEDVGELDAPRESRPAVIRGSSRPTLLPRVAITACMTVACIHLALSATDMAAHAGALAGPFARGACSGEPASRICSAQRG